MMTTCKIATLSAVLSAALVCGFQAQSARSTIIPGETAKVFQDRVPQDATGGTPIVVAYATTQSAPAATPRAAGKSDLLKVAPTCADQAWPHVSRDCLSAEAGTPVRGAVRNVAIEHRYEPNTSTLVKGAPVTLAAR